MTVAAQAPVSGAPSGREEAWRFTPLGRLRGLHERLADVTVPRISADLAPELRFEECDTADTPAASGPVEWPAALARAATGSSQLVTIPRGASASRTSTIRVEGTGAQSPAVAHLVVHAEPGSRAVVVVEHTGSATLSANLDVLVDAGADLTLICLNEWADDTVHLGRQHAVLGRDARFTSLVVTLGGEVVRVSPTVEYAAPGGEAQLLGLFFTRSGQHHEHRLLADHSQPHCTSDVVYKGVLSGHTAHSVWVGDVIIRTAAVGTRTYEINRNLLLTDGARADSVPNLEIETGNVAGAGHASATGRFDDEQLFYLQSRGIDAETARRLVVRGFFADLVSRVPAPEVADHVMSVVDGLLGHGGED